MRPKKRVMLYCADYERRNDLAYVLRVRCAWARIETFADPIELDEALRNKVTHEPHFDCVVLVANYWGTNTAGELNERIDFEWLMRDAEVAARTVELREKMDKDRPSLAGRRVFAGDIGSLADAMLTASARKRGPKTQVRPVVVAAVA